MNKDLAKVGVRKTAVILNELVEVSAGRKDRKSKQKMRTVPGESEAAHLDFTSDLQKLWMIF